jgi:hypothetical protein
MFTHANTPAALTAGFGNRWFYCDSGFHAQDCVGSTVLVLSPVVNAAFVARWISKLVSLLELSTQVSVTMALVPLTTAVPAKLEGAAGARTAAVYVFEYTDEPTPFTAITL